jgi:hypothetical protein
MSKRLSNHYLFLNHNHLLSHLLKRNTEVFRLPHLMPVKNPPNPSPFPLLPKLFRKTPNDCYRRRATQYPNRSMPLAEFSQKRWTVPKPSYLTCQDHSPLSNLAANKESIRQAAHLHQYLSGPTRICGSLDRQRHGLHRRHKRPMVTMCLTIPRYRRRTSQGSGEYPRLRSTRHLLDRQGMGRKIHRHGQDLTRISSWQWALRNHWHKIPFYHQESNL